MGTAPQTSTAPLPPPDPSVTHEQAQATVLAVLGGTPLGTFHRLDGGGYVNARTGERVDALPVG